MKRIASLLLVLSLLAAFALPVVQPTYSALAETDGSVVSDQSGGEQAAPPTETPTDVPAPTDTPVPPPTDTPAPPPTDTPAPTDVPATATQQPSATEEPVQPAADTATSTPVREFQVGDLIAAKVRVNCRATPYGSVETVIDTGQQAYVIAEAQPEGDYEWLELQLTDAGTTQCFSAKRYFELISEGNAIPPTAAPTNTPSATLTPTKTLTPTVTKTPSLTPTKAPEFLAGDLAAANTRVNCRVTPSGMIVTVVATGQNVYVLDSEFHDGSYDWIQLQLTDSQTTQCYSVAKYFSVVSHGNTIPATVGPSVTPSSTRTLTPTVTPSSTPTFTPTSTATPTLTGSETATLTPTITETATVTNTPTETFTPTATFTPSNTPNATNTATPTYRNLHAGDIAKASTSINCRSSTSAGEANITWILEQNDRVVVLTDPVDANGYYWSQVRPLGTTKQCYVVANYLDVVEAGGGLTPTPTATGSAEAAGPYKVGDIVETTVTVNVRTDAGTSFPIVDTVSSRTQGSVLSGFKQANGLDWIHVQFPSGSGWLAAKYTKLVANPSTTTGPYAAGTQLVITSSVNLRTLPGTSNPSLGQLQKGQQGFALGPASKVDGDTWIQVEFSIGSGWVSSAYVKRLSSVTPTVGPSASNVWVYLDCTANPERIIVQNNNLQSIRVISIGSTYQPGSGEPYAVGDTLGTKVTLAYETNSQASGNFRLTSREIFNNNVGAQEGVVVKTSLGDITASCPAVTSGEKWIEVNLSTQTLYAYRGSTVISSSLVSTGKPGFSTPAGTFYITEKYVSVTMAACINGECWNTPGVPWDMLFRSGGFYIHGAYWHHDFGKVRSHGCVNLPVPYAEWLYSWTPYGTRVWIHY